MSLPEWIRDLRLAFRFLAKNPGAAALSMLSIALGIGLTTGLFAVGDATLLRPPPAERPGEMWSVTSRGNDGNPMMYGWLDYLDMAKALEGRGQLVAIQLRGIAPSLGGRSPRPSLHLHTLRSRSKRADIFICSPERKTKPALLKS